MLGSRNIVIMRGELSGSVQVSARGQIQPWYHIRDSQEVYGMTWAVSTGYMPCYGQWPAEQVDLVRRWVESGKPA